MVLTVHSLIGFQLGDFGQKSDVGPRKEKPNAISRFVLDVVWILPEPLAEPLQSLAIAVLKLLGGRRVTDQEVRCTWTSSWNLVPLWIQAR